MSTHFGNYQFPICGTYIQLEVKATYQWTNVRPATRHEPADGGCEIEALEIYIGDERVTIHDWPEEVVRDIRDAITREHSQEYEEGEAA